MSKGCTSYLAGLLFVSSFISPYQTQGQVQIDNLDGFTIPNAYWVLESIKNDGKDVPKEQLKRTNQVLVIQDKLFFLSRNGLPDYYGPIDYKRNPEDKNQKGVVNFNCVNPIGGGVEMHMARFKLLADTDPSRSRNAIRLILVIRRGPEIIERANYDDKKPGLVVETYILK